MIKLRTQKIIIEMPRTTSEPFINITIQRIELDDNGKEVNVNDRYDAIYKKLSDVALESVPYFEVLPLNINNISVYGIADAIKEVATKWIIEKHGGTVSSNGDIIL